MALNEFYSDDITPEVIRNAKLMLDNQAFTMLVSHKLASLNSEVIQASEDGMVEIHREYWALRRFVEWLDIAAQKD